MSDQPPIIDRKRNNHKCERRALGWCDNRTCKHAQCKWYNCTTCDNESCNGDRGCANV
jgi:hypothetical protein